MSAADACIGLLEVRTIAGGIAAADAMAKAAAIQLVSTRVVEPGKHVTLIAGPVDDVRSALKRGRSAAGDDVVDDLFLPNAHPALLDALAPGARRQAAEVDAIGAIECSTVASTIAAGDAALKQAHVELIAFRIGADMGGKGIAFIAGEVSDVESAVTAGAAKAEARRTLVRTIVIPRPAPPLLAAVLGT